MSQPETGHYINDVLASYPEAPLEALEHVLVLPGPADEQAVDNPELVRGFTDWAATEYLQGGDYWGGRDTLWRGIHWAYTVANSCGQYIPTLRASNQLEIFDNSDHYQETADSSFGLGLNYPLIDAAAAFGQEYIDPDERFPLLASLGALAGFTMIDNNESKKELWRRGQLLEVQAISRKADFDRRIAQLLAAKTICEEALRESDREVFEGMTRGLRLELGEC